MMPWKMLVGPGLLLGLKVAKIQYDDPSNLLVIRWIYGISQGLLFAVCAYIYLAITQRGNEKKSLKIVTRPASTAPNEEPQESTLTYKEYDLSELIKLTKNFALGVVVTVALHYYMAVVPALVLQIVTQPITLVDHPLFSIYILDKDATKDKKLKRPFVDNSPAASLDAMKKAALMHQQSEPSSSVEGSESHNTTTATRTENGTIGGNAQLSLSTAEKRPSRPSATSLPEEE